MKNFWLDLNKARRIAAFLQIKYFDKPYCKKGSLLEFKIMKDLQNHPLYVSGMFLNLVWDNNRLLWLQVVTPNGTVPR
jgi:hypothetical protein